MARWEGLALNMRDPPRRRRQPPPGRRTWAERESEGPMVPTKPVKAGGGTGPWFWSASKGEEIQEIGKPNNSG